jgi:hypothetical protein
MRNNYLTAIRLLCIALILLIVNGCKKDENSVSSKRSELNDARKKWREQNVTNYQIDQSITCGECVPTGPFQITVSGNTIVSATNGKGQAYSGGVYKGSFGPFSTMLTVEEMFDYIEAGLKKNPERTDIRYDATYGYPRIAYFDYKIQIADDEFGYNITSFSKK